MPRRRARAAALVGVALAALAVGACETPAPSPAPATSAAGARTEVSWETGDALRYLAPSSEGVFVVSDRGAWTVAAPGAPAVRAACCRGSSAIAETGSVDLAGKPWVVRGDGTPVDLAGGEHAAAVLVRALAGQVTLPAPLDRVGPVTRVVEPRSVAVVDATTVLVATHSERGSDLPPGESNDVMVWRVSVGKPPTLLAGVPRVADDGAGWLQPAGTGQAVDPLAAQLDTISAMTALTADTAVLGVVNPYSRPRAAGTSLAVLAPGALTALTLDGSLPTKVSNAARTSARTVDVTAVAAGAGSDLDRIGVSLPGSTVRRGSGPGYAYVGADGRQVVATSGPSGAALTWTPTSTPASTSTPTPTGGQTG